MYLNNKSRNTPKPESFQASCTHQLCLCWSVHQPWMYRSLPLDPQTCIGLYIHNSKNSSILSIQRTTMSYAGAGWRLIDT